MNRPHRRPSRRPHTSAEPVDPTLRAAFDALTTVVTKEGYANLALADVLAHAPQASAAEATELTFGTCRMLGTHDLIIEAAAGRAMNSLQPAVQQVLRLTSHRLLFMNTPAHAAVNSAVALARATVGDRITGVVNAISRKLTQHDLDGWLDVITAGRSADDRLAITHHHPRWIADLHRELLGDDEADQALTANNTPATPTYVVRPGLVERTAVAEPEQFTALSPHGFTRRGLPGSLPEVAAGTVGIQDEGSQLVALALAAVADNELPWLDLCAGPGGKSALLTGLARQRSTWLLANEAQPHRARLVANGLRAYPDGHQVITGDGTRPAWRAQSFDAVIADVPCTGLGALRRRPEARWRKSPDNLASLVPLQHALLESALDAVAVGGVVAYVTCSPHPDETVDVVNRALTTHSNLELLDAPAVLTTVTGRADQNWAHPTQPRLVQLWPHRHGTDAMFLALLRRGAATLT